MIAHFQTQFTLRRAATHCNILQHIVTHCKTLQPTATPCRRSLLYGGLQEACSQLPLKNSKDAQDALSVQGIFHKRVQQLMVPLQKATCNLRHPMYRRQPVVTNCRTTFLCMIYSADHQQKQKSTGWYHQPTRSNNIDIAVSDLKHKIMPICNERRFQISLKKSATMKSNTIMSWVGWDVWRS